MTAIASESMNRSRLFRDAMGRFATGVTVVSTMNGGEVHGMTMNGFMSVSLDPQLVVISVANRARMRPMLEKSGAYGVSVLGSAHQELSDHFAGRPQGGLDISFVEMEGVPVIEDALVRLSTRVVDMHPAGDHTLFVGEVLQLDGSSGKPLVFQSGNYRQLVEEIDFVSRWTMPGSAWL